MQSRKPALDQAERDLVSNVLVKLRGDPETAAVIRENFKRLDELAALMRSYPSLYDASDFSGRHRDVSTLIRHLLGIGPVASPFRLPTKACLAHDFVLAKTQAFRAALLAMENKGETIDYDLCQALRGEIAQSIYTVLAEELLTDILFDDESRQEERRKASELLVCFWDDSTRLEIDDFCPLLESTWQSRNQLVVDFGTLMGSVEICRFAENVSDPYLVEIFCGERQGREGRQAFEEFIFGLLHEQLALLRAEMRKQDLAVVDRAWVAKTLSMPEGDLFSGVEDPEAMYLSHRKRFLAAWSRRLRGDPGPRRTAEMFLMTHILERG